MPLTSYLKKPVSAVIVLCALPLLFIPLTEFLAVAPFGSSQFLYWQMLIVLPAVVALLALPIAPFFLLSRKTRSAAALVLAGSITVTASCYFGLRLGERIRMDAFTKLSIRSAELVTAIKQYEQANGVPPKTLGELVPGFFTEIPGTGMRAYPDYRYLSGEDAASYEGNPWVLTVFTPSGGINFDQFIYLPRQNYPDKGFGGWLQRVNEWAYVHE